MVSPSDLHPLAIRFQQHDLQRLLQRLVMRLRRGQSVSGRLRFTNPSPAERRAIAALVGGSSGRGRCLSIDLDVLTMIAAGSGHFASLQHLVESAHGAPIANELAQRTDEHVAWSNLWSKTIDRCGNSPSLRRWVCDLKASGWIRRRTSCNLKQAERLFDDVFAVLNRLPIGPPVSRAQLAAELFGDSHALDATADLGRLAARGAAALAGCNGPRTAAEIRSAWANVGVVPDELSATVLVLNLPALPGTPLGDIISLHRRQGEPCRITFRQLRGVGDCRFDRACDDAVRVCENPSVVAAAAQHLGVCCRPLVCVEGQPNLAAETLLRSLHQKGFELHYHGDFDWGGLRIAVRLWKIFQFLPWRFGVNDYRAAPPGRPLKGRPADAPWDPYLRDAMHAAGTSVHEESVLKSLLADLSAIRDQ